MYKTLPSAATAATMRITSYENTRLPPINVSHTGNTSHLRIEEHCTNTRAGRFDCRLYSARRISGFRKRQKGQLVLQKAADKVAWTPLILSPALPRSSEAGTCFRVSRRLPRHDGSLPNDDSE
jgi:hypothetical protein